MTAYEVPGAVGVIVMTGKVRDELRTLGVVVGPGMVELAVVDEHVLGLVTDAYGEVLGEYGPIRVAGSEMHRLLRELRVGNPHVEERVPGRRSSPRSLRAGRSSNRAPKGRTGLSASIGEQNRLKKRLTKT